MKAFFFILGLLPLTGLADTSVPGNTLAVSGIDETAIDHSINPCDDFYQFACGSWIARTQIPSDRSRWTRSFSVIDEQNQVLIHRIFDDLLSDATLKDPVSKKVATYYKSCMDETAAETVSLELLKKELTPIDALPNKSRDLALLTAALHQKGANIFFNLSSDQDMKDATQVIANLDQAGLSLPDRDYYLKDDVKTKEIRQQYQTHIVNMLTLLGVPSAEATLEASQILKTETALAQASLDKVSRRDPKKLYHPMDRASLKKLNPLFDWDAYFEAQGHSEITSMNVVVPDFFKGLNDLVASIDMSELRTYLRWQTIQMAASTLGKAFIDERFRFMSQAFTGQKELEPRWKRCIGATQGALGEAVGHLFVDKVFQGESKTLAQQIIVDIEKAFHENASQVSWVDDPTRVKIYEKLAKIVNKIGYPDKWKTYDRLDPDPKTYLANEIKASTYLTKIDLGRIGKPLDRSRWFMEPYAVNAYYQPPMNEMVFPAGILQTPFFNRNASSAENYGAIGMVMGHELTHGFDDEGRQYDGNGNLNDWWTPNVTKAYAERAACIVKQYNGYPVQEDLHVNGELTLGENIADNGGIKLAYSAWRKKNPVDSKKENSNFTEAQKFFLSFAQGWCTKMAKQEERRRVVTDPHSPPKYRINGPLTNAPAFAEVFGCKEGSVMAPLNRCALW